MEGKKRMQAEKAEKKTYNSLNLSIIAIGASAGGLEAIQDFLGHLPPLSNTALIIAQHLSPTHKSMLVHLLSKSTEFIVEEAQDGAAVKARHIYVTPPDKNIYIQNDHIRLAKPNSDGGPKPSVDELFTSLYQSDFKHVVAVVLSGTGTDGSIGIKLLKNRDCLAIAQDPITAKYNGMPQAAIQTGAIDKILSPSKMGRAIEIYLKGSKKNLVTILPEEEESGDMGRIFKLLNHRTGTDFTNYKKATIGRRLKKRMDEMGIASVEDYLKVLEKDALEQDQMFNKILIGVTSFFRDKEAFESLKTHLHAIVDSKRNRDNLRIWVPGCSTGEEVFSLAILINEVLSSKNKNLVVQIFGTDIDEKAVQQARKGIFSEKSAEALPKEILEKYFITKENGDLEVIKALRSMVLFSKHDLISNPPFLKLDLISCRNLLIYFNSTLQQHVIPIFHYALNPQGYLFLGKSESINGHGELFKPVDPKSKIFQKKTGIKNGSLKLNFLSARASKEKPEIDKSELVQVSLADAIKDTISDIFNHPYVVINDSYDIQNIGGDVRLYMSLGPGDAQLNLIKLLNKELQIETRSLVASVIAQQKIVSSPIKKFTLFEKDYLVKLHVSPLHYEGIKESFYLVVFEDIQAEKLLSKGNSLEPEGFASERILELENELTAIREQLQTYIEELETTNEELQSLNEELQSTNEELQSSNEELETSNEELQSTNEEIQIAYTELKAATEELEEKDLLLEKSKAELTALLNNDMQAFFLLDKEGLVLNFNQKAKELVNELRSTRLLKGLNIVDILDEQSNHVLKSHFESSLEGETCSLELAIESKKGYLKWFKINYTPVVFLETVVSAVSLSFLDITTEKLALDKALASEKMTKAILDVVGMGVCVTDEDGSLLEVNDAYCRIYGYERDEIIGSNFLNLVPSSQHEIVKSLNKELLKGRQIPTNLFLGKRKDGEQVLLSASFKTITSSMNKTLLVTSIKDITEEERRKYLLDDIQEMALLGGWELNLISNKVTQTDVARKIHELEEEEVLPLERALDFYPEGTARSKVEEAIAISTKTGKPFDFESEFISKKGNLKWVRVQGRVDYSEGKPSRIFGYIQDNTEKKRVENQLSLMLKNIPGIVFRYKISPSGEGSILYVSENAYGIWGFEQNEILEDMSLIWDNIHKEDLPIMDKTIQESAKKLDLWTCEYRYAHPTQGQRRYKGIGLPNRLPDGSVIWDSIVLDITDEYQQRELFEENERKLDLLFNETKELPIQGFDHTGKVIYWNHSSESLYGFSQDEALGQYLWDLVIPELEKEEVKETFQKFLHSGEDTLVRENRLINKNKKPLWVFSNLTKISGSDGGKREVFSIQIDYTQLKENQIKIQMQENLLKEAEKVAQLGSWSKDFSNGKKILLSKGFFDLFGKPASEKEYLEIPFSELIEAKERKRVLEQRKSFEERGENYWMEYHIQVGKNTKVIEEMAFAEKDESGNIIRIYGTVQDITEKKQQQEELKKLNSELEAQTKILQLSNEELEKFAYVASHDLQEPLRMVSSFLTQLERKYKDQLDDKAKEYIYYAVDGSKRMKQIIMDLLDFSRVGKNMDQKETVKMEEMIHEILLLQKNLIKETGAKVTMDTLPNIENYRIPILQVFTNLINNALKYRKPNTKPEIHIGYHQEKNQHIFSIKDNGIGIEKEYFDRIFNLFQRLHKREEFEGSGIGLAIVKKLLEKLNGKIWLESEVNQGTTFYIRLPK